ncbi:MAG: hypothetical protein JSS22_05290 [Proteobacteria bacterium]|nr:hypothetical protein [Pseudomonadota bacterium]
MDAGKAGDFIGAAFRDDAGGFFTPKTGEAKIGVFAKPAKLADDQVQVARFMNMLNRYFGKDVYKDSASHAMRYLTGFPRSLAAIVFVRTRPSVRKNFRRL